MTPPQSDPIDLLLTHLGNTFPAEPELVRQVRDAHERGRLWPWVTVAWNDVHRPAVFFAADQKTATANVVVLRGERGWSDMWSTDLTPLAEHVGARIVDGRVER